MRVTVIILGLVAGQVMVEQTAISVRLGILIRAGTPPVEAAGSLVLFALWIGAMALVYPYPAAACWLFALAGGAGFYDGVKYGIEESIVWGWLAIGLAALTTFARWEKQRADQADRARIQHELAVHAALRSLHETVPELLTRSSLSNENESRLNGHGLVELRPHQPAVRDAARR